MKRLALIMTVLSMVAGAAGALQLASGEAVVLVNGSPLYEESGKTLKALEYLTLGDIVTLLNRTSTLKEGSKDRNFTRIRAFSGKEGWIRADYISSRASLAVVKAEEAAVFSEPRMVKLTGKVIKGMTLVAILQDGTTSEYAKIQGYDRSQDYLFTDSTFVGVDDLTTSDSDINAAILYAVAMGSKDAAVKKNLLKVAVLKYSDSIFMGKIQPALAAMP